MSIHTDALKDSWHDIANAFRNAVTDPSSIGLTANVLKEVAVAGSAFFKFFGIADSLNDIRTLWQKKNNHHGLFAKMGITFVHALYITATSIAAAVVLGATVVASPVATAIASVASFCKSIADVFRAHKQVKINNLDLQASRVELRKANISMETHLGAIKDLSRTQRQVNALKRQLNTCKENEKPEIQTKLKKREALLDNKKKMVRFFIEDPKNQIKLTSDQVLAKSRAHFDCEHAVKQAQHARNKNLKNVFFSFAVACLSVAACIVLPVGVTLGAIALGVAAVGGLSSLRDWHRHRNNNYQAKIDKMHLTEDLSHSLDNQMRETLLEKAEYESPAHLQLMASLSDKLSQPAEPNELEQEVSVSPTTVKPHREADIPTRMPPPKLSEIRQQPRV